MTTQKKAKGQAKVAATVLTALERLKDDQSTSAFRDAAQAIIALRQGYEHEDKVDWTGRSPEYRDCIERLYRQAEVLPDSEGPVQAKLRYHIGNVLREVAPADELEALGLSVSGPKGRARETRAAGGRRRTPAEVTRTRIDSPLTIAALGLDAVRMLQVMHIEDPDDRRLVDDMVRQILDEAVAYLKA